MMDDLIKRQDAIRVVREYMIDTQITDGDYHADGIERELYELPSEQITEKCMTCIMTCTEIVRCRDCRHLSHRNGGHCDVWDWYISNDAFYCGCGERKADG